MSTPIIPYPLRAMSLCFRIHPFGWGLHYHYRRGLSERARCDGQTLWWVRIGCVTISYGRML